MKKFFSDSKLPGKSTAAMICFCLAAVAALGIFSYNKASNELAKELMGVKDGTSETLPIVTEGEPPADDGPANEANIAVNNVPLDIADEPAVPSDENVILEQDAFGSTTETSAVSSEAAPASIDFDGACVSPVSGEILADYSDGELVKSKTLSVWKTHDGVDIAAQTGAAVRSAAAGVVTAVRTDPLMGVTVVIDHGSGYEGWYCNLSYDVDVSEGEEVSAGTVIGEVGSTAEAEIAEGEHLHFGVKRNGSWTDPADFISGEGS